MTRRLIGFEKRIELEKGEEHTRKWVYITNRTGTQNFLGQVSGVKDEQYISTLLMGQFIMEEN